MVRAHMMVMLCIELTLTRRSRDAHRGRVPCLPEFASSFDERAHPDPSIAGQVAGPPLDSPKPGSARHTHPGAGHRRTKILRSWDQLSALTLSR
eukprot:scaffold158659_cov33-Tisochrysis_lutea.AAC.2